MLGEQIVNDYLRWCECERRLDAKTIRAYRTDLFQFLDWSATVHDSLSRETMHAYLEILNDSYAPASSKRKIAVLRAFMMWAEEEGRISRNPFRGFKLRICEPKRLPRTIALADLNTLFRFLYDSNACSVGFGLARDRAIFEMLIATGVRVSELCALNVGSIDMTGRVVLVLGKGSKERTIQLENKHTIAALREYLTLRNRVANEAEQALFVNRLGARMSDRAVREMVNRRTNEAGLTVRVTPHMFRHTFATLLLEGDVDIRYIQRLLGHSSISTTEIYAHVSSAKLREIMRNNNPRKMIGA